jgi:hypothetical protein
MVFNDFIKSIDELSNLKYKILKQRNILKDYESWVQILLNIVNIKDDPSNHYDIATPIEKVNKF